MALSTKAVAVGGGLLISAAGIGFLMWPADTARTTRAEPLAEQSVQGARASDSASASARRSSATGAAGSELRMRMLEARVAALQARLEGDAAGGSDESEPPVRAAAASAAANAEDFQRAAEESKQRHLEAHEKSLKAHAAEAVDRSWAPAAAAAFREDVERAYAGSRAKLLEVDCRTTSCIARLEWPSFNEARANFAPVLHARYRVNCAKEITLPEPSDPSKPYAATAVFDCTDSRAQ